MMPAMLPSDGLVAVSVAAEDTGVPDRTIRRWLARGQLAGQVTEHGRLVQIADVKALAVEVGHVAALRWALDGQMAGQTDSRPANGHMADPVATEAGHEAGHTSATEFLAVIERQQQTISELSGRLGSWVNSRKRGPLWLSCKRQRAPIPRRSPCPRPR